MNDFESQSERPSDQTHQDCQENNAGESLVSVEKSAQAAAYQHPFLPPADELAKYQKLYPEITEALFELARAEMENRHKRDLNVFQLEKMRIENEKQRIENEKDYIQVSFKLSSAVFRVFTRGQRATVLILLVLIVGFVLVRSLKRIGRLVVYSALCFFVSYLFG